MSIFISYSRRQFYYVESLVLCLQSYGVSLWFDMQCLKGGIEWEQSIQDALHSCDGLIFIASRTALASKYVRAEWQEMQSARKPIYVVLFEKVELPPELANVSIIDGRGSFEKQMQLLSQLILHQQQDFIYQDRSIRRHTHILPTHLSLGVLLVIVPLWVCLLGSFTGLTIETINSLHELLFVYNAATTAHTGVVFALAADIVTYLLFMRYICYYLNAFLTRKMFNIYAFQYFALLLFASCLIPGTLATDFVNSFLSRSIADILFTQDSLLTDWGVGLSVAGGVLAFVHNVSFFKSREVLRWLPPGTAPVHGREEGNSQWVQTRSEQALKQVRQVTYKLYYDEADKTIAANVINELHTKGHKLVDTDQVDYHIFILTNRTPQSVLDYALKSPWSIICVVASSITISRDQRAFHRLQWIDYRRWLPESLKSLASNLCFQQSDSQHYTFPVLPETLERLVVPAGIGRVCFLFRLSAAFSLSASSVLLLTLWGHVLENRILQGILFLSLFSTSIILFFLANRIENRSTTRRSFLRGVILTTFGVGMSDWLYAFIVSGGNLSNFGNAHLGAAGFIIFAFSLLFLFFCLLLLLDDRVINASWPPFVGRRSGKQTKVLTLSPIKASFWHSTGFYLALTLVLLLLLLTQAYQSFH